MLATVEITWLPRAAQVSIRWAYDFMTSMSLGFIDFIETNKFGDGQITR